MTVSEIAELEYLVLSVLDQAAEPVGSGAVCEWLRQHGHELSEATAGRFLRELDFRGLTERAGFRGRQLTAEGQNRLAELRRQRAAAASSEELLNAIRATGLKDLVDVLVARRALEREIASLAAARVTDRDLEAMEVLLTRYEAADAAEAAAEADFAFHERLAEVAGNKVLQAATRLIRAEAESVPIPDAIRRRLKPQLARQHREILAALRARDPRWADRAMVAHLDGLIESVQQHWHRAGEAPPG